MQDITVITTERDSGKRLETTVYTPPAAAAPQSSASAILIDPTRSFQEILGFGGAFTTAGAVALKGMSAPQRQRALELYFSREKGLGYSLCRTNIGACDFSMEEYTYNDIPNDVEMQHFSVAAEEEWNLPFIKSAMALTDDHLLVYASPWSPPAWMKSNQAMCGGGRLQEEYYDAMALYIARFVQAYRSAGIPVWGVSAQNEPDEVQSWPSCLYSGAEERRFLAEHLLPQLDKLGLADVQILIWDSNKNGAYARARDVLEDPVLRRRVAGVAFHWYSGDYFECLEDIHADFPETGLFSTESCVALPRDIHNWEMGEAYGHEILGDLNHWANGYIDWNLFLTREGGPNMAGNYCAAPILLDGDTDTILQLSSYYYIGHFSKAIQRGALRVACSLKDDMLEAGAFLNPNGQLAVVVMNRQEKPRTALLQTAAQELTLALQPHSIQTLLIPAQ